MAKKRVDKESLITGFTIVLALAITAVAIFNPNGLKITGFAIYDAQCAGDTLPATMTLGETRTVSITMKNLGTNSWSAANNYKLGSKNPNDNLMWGLGRVNLPSGANIATNQQYTFIFEIKAPTTPGTYSSRWGMVREFITWFGPACGRDIVVQTSGANPCINSGYTACTDTWGGYAKEGGFRYGVVGTECKLRDSRFFCSSNKWYSCDPDENWSSTPVGSITATNNQVVGTKKCVFLSATAGSWVDATNDCIAKGYTACTDTWGGYAKEGGFRQSLDPNGVCQQTTGGLRFFCNVNKFYSCDPDQNWNNIGMITAANNQVVGTKKCVFTSATDGKWINITISQNIVTNGDFEQGISDWHKTPASTNATIILEQGNKYAQITSLDYSNSYLYQKIPCNILKGKRLHVVANVSTSDIKVGEQPYMAGKIVLSWMDNNGNYHYPELNIYSTNGWKQIDDFWQIGENCNGDTYLYIGFYISQGIIRFDDISLSISTLISVQNLSGDVEERIYNDGKVLFVDGKEFTEVQHIGHTIPFRPTKSEQDLGFVLFQTKEPSTISPNTIPARDEVINTFNITVAPGQYEPMIFSVFPLIKLNKLDVEVTELISKDNAIIPKTSLDIKRGIFVTQRIGFRGAKYHVVPKILVRKNTITNLSVKTPQLFWISLNVPRNTKGGIYTGWIRVTADGKKVNIPLSVHILPFKLAEGKPRMLYYYATNPANAELFFNDMKEHNANSVVLGDVKTPLSIIDNTVQINFDSSDKFIAAYKNVNFSAPLVYNQLHDRLASKLLELFFPNNLSLYPKVIESGETFYLFKEGDDPNPTHPEYPDYPISLYEHYKQIINSVHIHATTSNWPQTLFYQVDEPTDLNGWRMTAARMEYRLVKEAVPIAKTFSTLYSLPVIEKLPWVDIRAVALFYALKDEETNMELHNYTSKFGGEIWGVDWPAMVDDYSTARRLAGFLLAKGGLNGVTFWVYYTPQDYTTREEFNDLRGGSKQDTYFAYRQGSSNILVPTVAWEGLRDGLTDWRYINTLEEAIANTKDEDKRRHAKQVLNDVLAEIPWYYDSDLFTNRRANELRIKIINEIIYLMQP